MGTSHFTSHQWASLLWWLTCALTALGLIFLALNLSVVLPASFGAMPSSYRLIIGLIGLIYAAIGQYLARKRPQNVIGWLLLLFGFLDTVLLFATEYPAYTLVVHPGALPGGVLSAWIAS